MDAPPLPRSGGALAIPPPARSHAIKPTPAGARSPRRRRRRQHQPLLNPLLRLLLAAVLLVLGLLCPPSAAFIPPPQQLPPQPLRRRPLPPGHRDTRRWLAPLPLPEDERKGQRKGKGDALRCCAATDRLTACSPTTPNSLAKAFPLPLGYRLGVVEGRDLSQLTRLLMAAFPPDAPMAFPGARWGRARD